MKDVSQVTALVVDHGLFLPIAHRLAKGMGRVLYHTPWEKGFPSLTDCIIGDGYDDIELCKDFWPIIDDIDLFVFPDILHSGLQLHLEAMGKAVWGSRAADSIEINRRKFMSLLEELDMDVPGYASVTGITALREHLADKEDKYIKVSKFRGDWETGHWRSSKLDEPMLDHLACRFGPAKEMIPFLICDSIDTDIELGVDTFCIDGQFPDHMIHGYEQKDEGFLAEVQPRTMLPDSIQEVLEKFGPVLGQFRYRNSFTAEVRKAGEKSYFIDPCCRFPMPCTGSKTELCDNLPEVMLAGAHGELEQPKYSARFSAESCLTMKMDKDQWGTAEFPDSIKDYVKLSNSCQIDGMECFPPVEFRENRIGWIVATGGSIEETIQTLLERVKELPKGVSANTDSLTSLLKELEQAEKEGIEFSQDIPEPSIVVK